MLSDDELVKRAKTYDDEAIAELVARYKPMVRQKAGQFFLAGGDREDLVQEGMVGLFKAVRDYRRTGGACFRSFAEICVARQIISAIKQSTRQKQSPLNNFVSFSEAAHESAMGVPEVVVGDESDPADVVVLKERLSYLAEGFSQVLSGFERVAFSKYVVGKSYEEIAKDVHRRAKSVDNALQRARRKLEEYMAEKYT